MAYTYDRRAPEPSEFGEACALHRRFFGRAAERIGRARLAAAPAPRVLVELGELRALVYRAARGDHPSQRRNYVHFFEQPPRLLADAGGRRLFIAGGRYRVTPRGIEG